MMENDFITTYWAPILTSTIGGLIVFFVGRAFGKKEAALVQSVKMNEINYTDKKTIIIQKTVNNYGSEKKQSGDDGFGLLIIGGGIILFLTVAFIKYFGWIMLGFQSFIAFTGTVMILGFIEYYRKHVISGSSWITFLFFVLFSLLFSIYVLHSIEDPNIAISQVTNLEASLKLSEIGAFVKELGFDRIKPIAFQMLGSVTLLLAQWLLIVSLIYFYASVRRIIHPNVLNGWFVKITRAGSKPIRAVSASLIFLILSYLLTTGLFLKWIEL